MITKDYQSHKLAEATIFIVTMAKRTFVQQLSINPQTDATHVIIYRELFVSHI